MANETLSPRQANRIIQEYSEIISTTQNKMEKRIEKFVNDVSDKWEDTHATTFANTFKSAMDDLGDSLVKNAHIFTGGVSDIAKAYIKTGGVSGSINADTIVNAKKVDISKIKEFFANSENGDDFGFKNVEAADEVITSYKDMITDLVEIATSASQRINKINAFGNVNIGASLGKSGAKVISLVQEAAETASSSLKETITGAANAYKSTGKSAESAANMSEK